jgi:hypothetical protein
MLWDCGGLRTRATFAREVNKTRENNAHLFIVMASPE